MFLDLIYSYYVYNFTQKLSNVCCVITRCLNFDREELLLEYGVYRALTDLQLNIGSNIPCGCWHVTHCPLLW